MYRAAQIILMIFILIICELVLTDPATSKSQRTSKIPEVYKPFLSGIGSLRTGKFRCTAFCVASDVIATSQHCLQTVNERWKSSLLNVRFEAEHKGKILKSSILGETVSDRKINVAFGLKKFPVPLLSKATKRDRRRFESDWSLIKLKRKICHSILPVKHLLGLAFRTQSGKQHAALISAEKFSHSSTGRRWIYSGKCRFLSAPVSIGSIAHDCPSRPGVSGSPIFFKDDDGKLVVVAVNTGRTTYKVVLGRRTRVNRAVTTEGIVNSLPHFLAHERFSDQEKLKEIQKELKMRRHLKDNVDGRFGPNTRFAIISFEHSIGLPELGLPSVLIYDLLTGQREIPHRCNKGIWKRISPPECKNIGLPSN